MKKILAICLISFLFAGCAVQPLRAPSYQSTNADELATYAAQLAIRSTTGSVSPVAQLLGQKDDSSGGINNYVYTSVHSMVLNYCAVTNCRNGRAVVERANARASEEAKFTEFSGSLTTKSNIFVSTYRGSLIQQTSSR